MNINDLKPAREFALKYGAKAIIFGPAGSAKTPILNTAPRPLLLMCEPGMLSMTNSNIPTYPAFDTKALNEFFNWFRSSKETSNFDTLGIDSVSQMCETILTEELKTNRDGRKAYGELSRRTMEILNGLYYTPAKHLYLIFKEQRIDDGGVSIKRPYVPGQDLPVKIPHLFDFILRLAKVPVPSIGETLAFKCTGSIDVIARNRTGNLNEYEPPHFGNLIIKALGQ